MHDGAFSSDDADVRRRTAESFAYEWQQFGGHRPEWERNFLEYLAPLSPESLRGRLVLDVGCGSGRHSRVAGDLGARVVAADVGDAIDVARERVRPETLTVQADAEQLPFAPGSFDLVMSIGVLHHLPDTARALRKIAPLAKPGGHVHVYLYWQPELRWHRAMLGGVGVARRVTVRLPHRVLRVLCYPIAAVLHVAFVVPQRALRRRSRGRRIAAALPLRTYADYPFGVLVNDQFDRFSAPIEQRFERAEVEAMLRDAGLVDVVVVPNSGWVGSGRVPATAP
jgi:2-polyprenyl-3-methyl-5-hydroxy-6-metoxy-1,4-benzoquinol methylase